LITREIPIARGKELVVIKIKDEKPSI